MRRNCWLAACTLYLTAASVVPLPAAHASAPDAKSTPRRGIAVLASSIGSDCSPEDLAAFVQQWHFSPVVIDWAWITAHWDQTDFSALNRFVQLLAAEDIPVAAMYRPRFLNNPTVPTQTDRSGKPAASHGYYICFSSPQARQWGISWGTRILQRCPQINEIIIYNPLNQCQCPACQEAARGNPDAHYDAVWRFLAEAKAAWQQQKAAAKLGVVFVNDPEFWQRGAQVVDIAHPFLFITDDTDMARDAREAGAIRDLLPGKMGSCLAKITWGENDRVSPARLAEFDRMALEGGLPYFFWTFDTLFDPRLYDQKAVAQVLSKDPYLPSTRASQQLPPSASEPPPTSSQPPPAPAQPAVAVGQPGNLTYSAQQIRSISAAVLLERMLHPEPGYWQFAALNALAQKARESDAPTRGQILSLVIAAMKDKSRPIDQRWQCCYVISESRYEQGVPDLIELLLHDDSDIVRSVAAEALGNLAKSANSAAAHDGLLRAARQETSARVLEVLAHHLGPEMPAAQPTPAPAAIPVPAPAPEERIPASASSSYQGVTNPPGGFHGGSLMYSPEQIRITSAEVLLERMLYPQQDYNQFAALNALIQKVNESDPAARDQIMSLVIRTMHDQSRFPYQRWQCCYVISDSRYEQGVPDLIEVLLHDSSDTVRAVAEEALKQFPENKAARDALLEAARQAPASQAPEAFPPQPGAASTAGQPNKLLYTPEQIRGMSTQEFLNRMLQPEPGYQEFAAMNALAQKAKESSPAIRKGILSLVIAAMHDSSRPVYQRYQCCYVLSGCGDERAVPDLVQVLLGDQSDTMRAVAAEALAQFAASAAARDALLQAARRETSPNVLEVLTRRLGKEMPAPRSRPAPAVARPVEELAPAGPPQPPPGPAPPVTEPLPWPFPGDQKSQEIFNNYQQVTDIYVHGALDFIHPAGTPVMAVDSGYVAAIYTNYPDWITHYFFIVTPEKGGREGWCYTHLDPRTFTFKEGDFVHQGQRLGSLVDFSVGNQPGVSHLHLHYVSFTISASGEVKTRSLMDPLYFFDWHDTEPPLLQPLRFVVEDTNRQFQADAAGVVTVGGRADILAAVADSAYPGHLGNLGVPVVMFSISDGTHTMQKLVVDHRGALAEKMQVQPLYLSDEERKAFINPDSFPRYQMLRVTKTDGDGRITPRDARECWDTTALDRAGNPVWPDGQYSVNVYAWDIAGNRAVAGALVRVNNG
jgi:HEAT repeat protein